MASRSMSSILGILIHKMLIVFREPQSTVIYSKGSFSKNLLHTAGNSELCGLDFLFIFFTKTTQHVVNYKSNLPRWLRVKDLIAFHSTKSNIYY